MLQRSAIPIFLFIILNTIASATNYYVSITTGNDNLDGLSEATAWKTISKVNGKTFQPGDAILFKKGNVWRETLIVPSSGSAASYLNFATYGTGANPRILGSTQAISWTNQGGNIWKSGTAITDPYTVGSYGAEVFFENTNGTVSWGTHQSSTGSCIAEYNWTVSSNSLYVYAVSDPTTRYNSVEAPQRTNSINLNDKNYLHFDGIDIFYVAEAGYTYKTYPMQSQNGLIIENSNIGYVSVKNSELGYGIDASYSNMTVRGCEIHDCGRRGISFHVYGSITITNVLIEQNYFHDGFHTTGTDFSVGSSSSYLSHFNGVIVRRNKFYDPPTSSASSNQIFIQNYRYSQLDATIENLYIYSNIFISPSQASIQMEGSQSVFIYNNTFYNHNSTKSGNTAHVWVDHDNASVKVKNNIFYSDLSNDNGGNGGELFVNAAEPVGKVDANYNLYYRINNNLRIVEKESSGVYHMNEISLIRSGLKWEINSPTPANPLFVSSSDFHLQAGSPALGGGIQIPEVASDYEGNPFTNSSIGCFATQLITGNPAYRNSSIENATPSLLTVGFNLSLANILPAASSFTVVVNSVSRTVNAVAVSGANVLLTLSSPVVYGDVVTVAYTKPSLNPLQTSSGAQATNFSAQAVTNNVAAVNPTYVSSVIANASSSILTITYNLNLANILPAASAFTVRVNSISRTVNTVAISATNVLLTLASPVAYGDVVTVAYTKPASNPLQTSAGGQAATIGAQTVTNNVSPVNPVYVSSVIANASPAILTMTYNLSLANIVPVASAFTVLVNSVVRTVNSVSVSGTNVLLTLASPVVYGDVITISYTKPASNPLQSSSGRQAASMTAQTVTNSVSPVNLTYISSAIANASPTALTMTYNLSLANILPAVSAFTVKVNSVTRNVNSLSISGTNVVLTLASPVFYGDVVTVAYTKPATNPLQSSSGSQASTIGAQSVTNNVTTVNLIYVSSVIADATPSLLTMTFNVSLSNIVPAGSAFTVMVNSVNRTVSTVAITGTTVLLTLASPVVFGDVVTVAYTKPTANPLQSSTGNQAASFGAKTVTNNVNPVNLIYVSSAVENASPTLLTMTMSLNLANILPAVSAFTVRVNSIRRTVNSVAVSGANVLLALATPVVYGDVITIAYTKPATNPLQSSSGSQASTIGAQSVTNNVNSVNLIYVSSVIADATPALLTMTFNVSLSNIVPAGSAFTVMVNSVNRTVNSVAITGTTVLLTLASPVVFGDVVTVAYTKPTANPLQSSTGNQAASFGAKTVTNNVNPVDLIYVSSAIENISPAVLTMTMSLNLANILPDVSAFTVQVNSLNMTVNSVAISGTNVLLTIASPVVNGDVITVAYSKPASNPLQSTSGSQASNISAQTVTNNVLSLIPAYVSSVIADASPAQLTMSFNISLSNIVPAGSAFTVIVNTVNRTVSTVAITGTTVLLTLASPVVFGDVVTVAYAKPSANPLQNSSGNQVASFGAQTVTNNVLPLIPAYVSSVIASATPSLLTMTYNLNLADIIPDVSAFTVLVNSVNRTVSSVSVSGTNVLLTLASPVVYGDIVTVAYTQPSNKQLQTSSGSLASSIGAQTVTNNIGAVIPVYVSSSIVNATPALLTVTYSIDLANIVPAATAFTVRVNARRRTISSVSVSGKNVLLSVTSPVAFGDVVTVAYTKPFINQLQSPVGTQASSIGAQAATNNVNPVIPYYVSSVIENATPTLLSMTYNLNLANIIPPASAFSVIVNSVSRAVVSTAIVNGKVQLTLVSPVVYGDVITVGYDKPSSNPLQTSAGGQAVSIILQTVTNNVNPAIPNFVNAVIENATPTLLTITYNLGLANTIPGVSAFTVRVNSVVRTISSIAIVNGKVQLKLSSPVLYGNAVTVAYTKPASNPLQTQAGGQATSLSVQPVTNNVNLDNPGILSYSGSVIDNATPSLITMTYTLSLANIVPATSAFTVRVNTVVRTIYSVTIINGKVQLLMASPVVYGDTITVAYTKPALNPIQTSSGAQAASIIAQPVTNNVNFVNPDVLNYVSSVIENVAPDLLIMTYNLGLAFIVPDVSAFSVQVNSAVRPVNSVDISGTDVLVTLSSPVVFGDIVTVTYNKPATNPIQTESGALSDSILAQLVTNNVIFINTPPTIVVDYYQDNYSGFVGEIDASGSNDADNDNLTFEWIFPDSLEVSSTSDSKIQFLAPMVQSAQTIQIFLNVSDSISVQSQTIEITILPYQPEYSAATIKNISASEYFGTNYPADVNDNNTRTLWSSNGANQWINLDLDKPFDLSYFEVAFQKGQRRSQYFDIYASKDSLNWDAILIKASSCNFAGGYQIFDITESVTNSGYSFIRLIGQTNSEDSWNNISEFKIFGTPHKYEIQMTIYPNPARGIFNVSLEYPPDISISEAIVSKSKIRILNMSGMLMIEKPIDPLVNNLQIPINLKSGSYIVQMVSSGMTLAAQKLIVIE